MPIEDTLDLSGRVFKVSLRARFACCAKVENSLCGVA